MATLLWLKRELRLADNPALQWALARGEPVIPVVIQAPEELAPWAPGPASNWWLHHSLKALDGQLRRLGGRLILRRGPTPEALSQLAKATGATAVAWNTSCDPVARQRERHVAERLRAAGQRVSEHSADLLFPPELVHAANGNPYKVFTPWYKACSRLPEPREPEEAPTRWLSPETWPDSLSLDALELLPKRAWADEFGTHWQPGEAGANEKLERFLEEALGEYPEARDRPDKQGTSRLSPHLHFGELSPHQLWHAARAYTLAHERPGLIRGEEAWLRQLAWREFAHHLLLHFPETDHQPLYEKYRQLPWRDEPAALRAWQRGQTGYPLIDAGMRELWTTGWMHNRVRMLVGSFLVKDLLIHWLEGATWFWSTLVDADLANNTLGWQWVAGCGADAAPWFRIFNPVTQSRTFDPLGTYIRRWVPELADLPDQHLHAPWLAPVATLRSAGIQLGSSYPGPIGDHAQARLRALDAFDAVR